MNKGHFLGWTCEPHLAVTSFLKYTLGVLAFKCVKGLAPSYLCHRFKTRDNAFMTVILDIRIT